MPAPAPAPARSPSPQDGSGEESNQSNVAMAYPPQQSTLSRMLPMLMSIVILVAYFLYQSATNTEHLTVKGAASTSANDQSLGQETTADTTTTTGPRLAACYTGHVGTFAKVYKQNVDALSDVFPSVSNFLVLDLDDDYKHARTEEHYKRRHEIGSLQPIFDELAARGVETFSSRDVVRQREGAECIGEHAPIQDDGGHFSHAFATLHASAKCYEMVRAEEERTGVKYDWLLRLRPDMEIEVTLPKDESTPRVHMSGLAIALVPRSLGDVYFSAVDGFADDMCSTMREMDDSSCRNYSYENESPECFMIKWLTRSDIVPSNGVHVNRRIVYPTSD